MATGQLSEKYGTKSPVWKHFADQSGWRHARQSGLPNLQYSSRSENWQQHHHLKLLAVIEK